MVTTDRPGSGDECIINLPAEFNNDAELVRFNHQCPICDRDACHECNSVSYQRAHGRTFERDDAETAATILGSVWKNHTA